MCGGENGKKLIFWRASKHYLINAYMEKSDMLHSYASWGGLEAH